MSAWFVSLLGVVWLVVTFDILCSGAKERDLAWVDNVSSRIAGSIAFGTLDSRNIIQLESNTMTSKEHEAIIKRFDRKIRTTRMKNKNLG